MKRKMWFILILAAILGLGVPQTANAFHGASNPYEMYHQMGLDEKFFFKAHFLLKNQLELGLSEEQVRSIIALKLDAKKFRLKQEAEIGILKIDIMGKLSGDKMDAAAVGELIDKKYELKKAKAKYFVDAYIKLKGILTDDQKKAGKAIWLKKLSA